MVYIIGKETLQPMNLVINGQIDSGSIADADGICIKYDLTEGKCWKHESGNKSGIS